MKQEHMKKKVQDKFVELINGYVEIPPIASYIVTPELGDSAGIIGGLALARKAIRNK